MKIAKVELFDLSLPLVEPFAISGGVMRERRSLVVALHDGEGHVGYGESPPFELPFYSEETLAGARHLLSEVLIRRLAGREVSSPEEADEILRAGVRGNPFARSALDTAVWDLESCRRGVGLAALLAERLAVEPATRIRCGVALGIPADRSLDTLRRWIIDALAKGYHRVKIKVAPGWDVEPVRAAAAALAGTGVPLTLDANGAYEWPRDRAVLLAMDETDLLYFEQPLAPDELVAHALVDTELRAPICVDETLRDARAARQILDLDGPRVWNLKVHRVGGLTETCRIVRLAVGAGVSLWAGTMPESGLGSQAAIAAASLPPFVYPSDVEPSARWFGPGKDVIELTMSPDGLMEVPTRSIASLLDRDRFQAASRQILALEGG
jgi:O-succinylbenzoate synthase